MSYLIGWKNEKSAFIVGDSLLTYSGNRTIISPGNTSFNETLKYNDEEHQIEGCNKIFNFNNKLLIGFASKNTLDTVELLEYIEENLDYQNIRKSLVSILDHMHPDNTQLIIAYTEDSNPVLLTFDVDIREIEDPDVPIQIGSGNDIDEFSNLSFDICDYLSETTALNDTDALTLSIAVHQHLMVKLGLISVGAGGLFTGAFVNQEGVHWQSSTSYIQYRIISSGDSIEKQFDDIGLIHIKYFGDVMTFFSSYIDIPAFKRDYLVRCDPNGTAEQTSKRAKYRVNNIKTEQSDQYLNSPKSDYIVLFSTQNELSHKVTIIRNMTPQSFADISNLDQNGYYTISVPISTLSLLLPTKSLDDIDYNFIN